MIRIIIAGTRDFTNYELLQKKCNAIIAKCRNAKVIIISGTARGTDQMGERYATENDYELWKFPADWDTFGKRAGYLRNEQMACNADVLIAFWDGSSKGTKHMIDIARRKKLVVFVEKI